MLTQAPRRPLGVSIIAILDIIAGIIALLGGIFGFLGLGLAGEHLPKIIDAVAGIALVFAIILGLAALIVGWGLWTLRRWAYWTTIVLEVLTIIDHLLGWASHHIGTLSLIADIIIPVIIVVYLLADRNVREAFRV
ncbi:MAG TPA: hypothetical protein VFA41_08200 [Ktedonobacteraceae bacterium]|jgi:uncharacterized membrane protein (DUF2068 family)|nr:hypothetical protein [Ktedonobacteraceae bacterium]